ncbi:MAG: B12-binding domain-containing radical SAM protein [Candidatus Hodarchaeales archaeon]
MKRFIAGRDCRHSCTYCFNHLYHKIFKDQKDRFFQITSPRKMVEEVKQVKRDWGLELAYFNDDDLACDRNWLVEFCQLFAKETGLEFCGSVRADSLDHELVKLMAQSGCTFLNIALESSRPSTQRILRRGNVTNGDIAYALEWCRKFEIKTRLQNMIGLPVDDPLEDALETLAFNIRFEPTDSWVSMFQPYPKTDAWQYCIDKGLLDEYRMAPTFVEDTILNFPYPIHQRLGNLAKWWHFAVKHKLSRKAVLDLIDIPLTTNQKGIMQKYRWEQAAKELYGL